MNEESRTLNHETGSLAQDAQNLMSATADVTGEKAGEARKRLAAALDQAKALAGRVRVKAVESAKAADEAVREHPYQAVAIGLGLGLVAGYLLGRRNSRD